MLKKIFNSLLINIKQLILRIMRTAQICPTCATYTNAVCVVYDGPAVLTNIPANPLDNLDLILVNLNTTIGGINNEIALLKNLTLQDVVTNGNTTNQSNIFMNGNFGYLITLYASGSNSYVKTTGKYGMYNTNTTMSGGGLVINNVTQNLITSILPNNTTVYNGGGNSLTIEADVANYAGNTLTYPSGTGTFALSVDGVSADNTGNISVTLQMVLDENHDLVNGNNFQGTGAGIGNTGTFVIALGQNAGNSNSGTDVNALGQDAATNNTGGHVNAFGSSAAFNNSGSFVLGIGGNATQNNSGNFVNAIGESAAFGNSGIDVNAMGRLSANSNSGADVNFFGRAAGDHNTADNVNAFGVSAGAGNGLAGMTIFSNASMPSYANHAAATAAITALLGASAGCTYLYHNQATNSIGAVRIP